MGKLERLKAALSPRVPMQLAADVDPNGMLIRTANPPVTSPTSPLIRPIGVTSAVDAFRLDYVERDRIMRIPSFRRAATLIAGTAAVPYHAHDKSRNIISNAFISQPEAKRGYTRTVTYSRLALDLIFEGSALWRVTKFDSLGFPTSVRHVPFKDWEQDPGTGEITMDGEKVPDHEVRLFISPFPGWSDIAGPTVVMSEKIRAYTGRHLDNPQAREYLKETAGLEMSQQEVEELLADWDARRAEGVTAFLPMGFELHTVEQMNPAQMLLKDVAEWKVAEACRISGIDASWNYLNITTRQYSNIIDERRNLIDLVVAPLVIKPIEERLSMDDFLPHGQYVKANLDAFLRANTLERMEAYKIGTEVGAYTRPEVRELEDKPDIDTESE